MRITITVNSKDDVEAAITALRFFMAEKKDGDGTSSTWGIGVTVGEYFSVGIKKNGNYTVKHSQPNQTAQTRFGGFFNGSEHG